MELVENNDVLTFGVPVDLDSARSHRAGQHFLRVLVNFSEIDGASPAHIDCRTHLFDFLQSKLETLGLSASIAHTDFNRQTRTYGTILASIWRHNPQPPDYTLMSLSDDEIHEFVQMFRETENLFRTFHIKHEITTDPKGHKDVRRYIYNEAGFRVVECESKALD